MKPVDQQLFKAIKQGHPTAVQHALMDGANPNSFSPKEEMTALAYACSKDVSELVRMLCKFGADTNQTIVMEDVAEPLLYWVSKNGWDQSLHCLLDGFSDIHVIDSKKNNALHAAVDGKHLSTVKMLVKKGVDVLHLNNDGLSPRDIAIKMKRLDMASAMPIPENQISM